MRDATLLAKCSAFIAADREMKRWGSDDNAPASEGERIGAIWYHHLELVTALAPHTQEGAIAKARVGVLALESLELSPVPREEQAALAALRDVVALEPEEV